MAELKKIPQLEYLAREGDPATAMYIVKSGSFLLTQTKAGREIPLAEIQSGEIVGELSLFDGKRIAMNIKAKVEAEVIAIPYETLLKQIETLPAWAQILMKTMMHHLRAVIEHVREHAQSYVKDEQFSPHLLVKYISILNFVSLKHSHNFSSVNLRDDTLQVFQEASAKMNAVVQALVRMGFLNQEGSGESSVLKNLKPQELIQFADWYRAWLFKPEQSRVPEMREEEVKTAMALAHFAKRSVADNKGFTLVNLSQVQTQSQQELGYTVSIDAVNALAARKYIPTPAMSPSGVSVQIALEELAQIATNFQILNLLNKALRS